MLPRSAPTSSRAREPSSHNLFALCAPLPEGAVDLWFATLAPGSDHFRALLSLDEHERAARILSPHRRLLWERARGVLRHLLGGYLREDARALRFDYGQCGKPELRAPGERAPLAFNLSHSRDHALYAISAVHPVGVDIELAQGRVPAPALVERLLGTHGAGVLAGLAPAARERAFLQAWVQREARLKCAGTGIRGASRHGQRELRRAPVTWAADITVGARAIAAIASPVPPARVRCWEMTPRAGSAYTDSADQRSTFWS